MKRVAKTFHCYYLLTYPLVQKITVRLRENSSKHNQLIDRKQMMENFNTPDLHRFSQLGKSKMHNK